MKHTLSKTYFLVIGIILIWGLYLRIYNWETYSLGFDQVQIVTEASKIVQGDFTLIGPMTGPAQMFTGPLIYYLTAPFMWMMMPVYTLMAVSLLIASLTGLTVWFLSRRYFKDKTYIFLALWAFSPYVIALDRITWNPSLTLVTASLVLIPLLARLPAKKLTIVDSLLIAVGLFLTYQAHFSTLFLVGIFFVTWLWYFRNQWLALLLGIGSFVASIVPTILFDTRNEYLNARGLSHFIADKVMAASGPEISWVSQLVNNLWVTVENMGKLLWWGHHELLIYFFGILFFVLYFIKVPDKRMRKIWIASVLLAIILLFSFYKGAQPEYYFIIQFPLLLYILMQTTAWWIKKSYIWIFVLGFAIYATFMITHHFHTDAEMTIGNQLKMAKAIIAAGQKEPIESIVYDTNSVSADGLKYLLQDFSFALNDTHTKIHVVYPVYDETKVAERFSSLGYWIDRRREADNNYLETNQFIIQSPADVFLYQDYYLQPIMKTSHVFTLFEKEKLQGWLVMYKQAIFKDEFSEAAKQIENRGKKWVQVDFMGKRVWGSHDQNYVLLLIDSEGGSMQNYKNSIGLLSIK